MPKRLKGPKYDGTIKFLNDFMNDPKMSMTARMNAAIRIDEMNARGEALESATARSKEKKVEHDRKLELRALQVANPTIPMPALEPVDDGSARMQSVLDSVLKPEGGANGPEG